MTETKRISRVEALGPIIIIGNGMVSWRLCRALVDLGVPALRQVKVFGEEPIPAYDRVNLTKYFQYKNPDALLLAGADWYKENHIELITGRRIVELDRSAKVVVDDQGDVHNYGECVLATGSRAFVPEIDGIGSKNVFVYRNIEDINAIKAAAANARRGLVIGGGLLGIEAANVLKDLNVETCIVQASNGLMSRQLDEDGASYLLHEVAELGMRVRLKTQTQQISPQKDGLEVSFNRGESMLVDLVIVATGISPRDELAVASGLPTAARGGVIVDDRLCTEDPYVFAIGECASHRGVVYGLVAPGYEMADNLARRLAGRRPAKYKGSDHSCRLKLLGVEVSTFGDYLQEGRYHVYRGEDCYRALVFEGSRLKGATVVGEWKETAVIEQAVKERRRIGPKKRLSFERTGELFGEAATLSVLDWPDHAVVCNCTRTNCGTLKQAMGSGCLTVAALSERTGAGTVCGSCLPQLALFVGADSEAMMDQVQTRGGWLLKASGIIALLVCIAFLVTPPLPAAKTVQSAYYAFTQIWQDSMTKQITGYSIAGLSLLALLLSARKRIGWLHFGNYGFWRAAHSWLGVLTLGGIFMHTGLNFGENLNLWLLICFLGLNLAGGLTAVAIAAEKRFSGPAGARFRAWTTKAHILFFLPYPVLLGFHIAKVYIY